MLFLMLVLMLMAAAMLFLMLVLMFMAAAVSSLVFVEDVQSKDIEKKKCQQYGATDVEP